MNEYETLDHSALVEMLLHQTEKLTHLLRDKEYNGAYHECKKMIEELSDEIRRRRKHDSNPKENLL